MADAAIQQAFQLIREEHRARTHLMRTMQQMRATWSFVEANREERLGIMASKEMELRGLMRYHIKAMKYIELRECERDRRLEIGVVERTRRTAINRAWRDGCDNLDVFEGERQTAVRVCMLHRGDVLDEERAAFVRLLEGFDKGSLDIEAMYRERHCLYLHFDHLANEVWRQQEHTRKALRDRMMEEDP
jgi:hypothetical protein